MVRNRVNVKVRHQVIKCVCTSGSPGAHLHKRDILQPVGSTEGPFLRAKKVTQFHAGVGGRRALWAIPLPTEEQRGRSCARLCSLSPSLSLTSFSSWKLSRGRKGWRLGWLAGGLGRDEADNTFQILIKFLFVVCSLSQSVSQSLGVSLSSPLSLFPPPPGFPLSLSLPLSQRSPSFSSLTLSLSLLSLSMFLTLLSASTSVCPSLLVPVHLSVSLGLSVRGCLCPSVLPSICLC